MATQARNLWDEALSGLTEDQQKQYQIVDQGHAGVLEDLTLVIKKRKDECVEKQWKVSLHGRTIVLRDVLEKLSTWVDKAISIGDLVVQYAPAQAALPWAAIKLILTSTVMDVETFGGVLRTIEDTAKTITRCAIQETLYLRSSFKISDQLREAIVTMYAAILTYMVDVLKYLSGNTLKRFVKASTDIKSTFTENSQRISHCQSQLTHLTALAEAERAEALESKTDEILQAQKELQHEISVRDEVLLRMVSQLDLPIRRMNGMIDDIHDALKTSDRAKILQAISNAPYGKHHKTAARDRLPDSGQWLLNMKAYREWRSSSSSSVLWLHGIPGSGKTKLTSLVVDRIKDDEQIAFFYCARTSSEPYRAQSDKILASLVRQLCCTPQNRAILQPVVDMYDEALSGFAGFEDQEWTSAECLSVLLKVLSYYPAVTIILDALDEVEQTQRPQLLDVLSSLVQQSPTLLKIFVSSRENYDIVLRLKESPNVYIHMDENAQDIEAFINDRVTRAKLLHGSITPELRETVIKTLRNRSQGMFRIVDLQMQTLSAMKTAADIEARLTTLPVTLEESYWELYTAIKSSGDHSSALADLTFQWLLYCRDTIGLDDLALLTAFWPDRREPIHTAAEIHDICAVLISVEGTRFSFSHLSVREFFEARANEPDSVFQAQNSHAAITSACITYMIACYRLSEISEKDFHNLADELDVDSRAIPHLYQTDASASTVRAFSLSTKEDIDLPGPRLLREYTAAHWVYHLESAGSLVTEAPLAHRLARFTTQDIVNFYSGMKLSYHNPFHYAEVILLACDLGLDDLVHNLLPRNDPDRALANLAQDRYWGSPTRVWTTPIWYCITHSFSKQLRWMLAFRPSGLRPYLPYGVYDELETLLPDTPSSEKSDALFINALTGVDAAISQSDPTAMSALVQALAMEHDLILAMNANRPRLVRFLLACGLGKAYYTPYLVRAFRQGHTEIADILMEFGARKDPAQVARIIKLKDYKTATLLINLGYVVNGCFHRECRSALHHAAAHAPVDLVVSLLDNGALVAVVDAAGDQPIDIARRESRTDVVLLLEQYGASHDDEDQSTLDQHDKTIAQASAGAQDPDSLQVDEAEVVIRSSE